MKKCGQNKTCVVINAICKSKNIKVEKFAKKNLLKI